MRRTVPTGQFRRRLTVTFVLVAGLAAGTVGLGAYLLVRDVRSDDFLERSLRDAAANFFSIEQEGSLVSRGEIDSILTRLERRAADATVIVTGDDVYSSDPGFAEEDLPRDLTPPGDFDEGEDLPHEDMVVADRDYLVVATPFVDPDAAMYFFYSREALKRGLDDLARITWRLWLVVVIAAALVGNALARRTLRPVSRASRAAQSLAEGLLETRLPVESEDEFGAWALSFNEMADALEVKISELVAARDRERRFTSDVSHELRTPVTALVSSASMLEEHLARLDPDARWMAERMIAESRRLRGLVDDLLEISRLHAGREVVSSSDVDLGRLIDNVLAAHHWHERVEFVGRPLVVSTDKARVERVLVNLIGNAVEHGGEHVQVTLAIDAGNAIVAVRDDGPGIPPAAIPHLFERFYKADPARPRGSGLGLAIARQHARLLSGSIDVDSTLGKGTTFTLRIPAQADPPANG